MHLHSAMSFLAMRLHSIHARLYGVSTYYGLCSLHKLRTILMFVAMLREVWSDKLIWNTHTRSRHVIHLSYVLINLLYIIRYTLFGVGFAFLPSIHTLNFASRSDEYLNFTFDELLKIHIIQARHIKSQEDLT